LFVVGVRVDSPTFSISINGKFGEEHETEHITEEDIEIKDDKE
jgi:hypothetical protein